MPLTVTDRDPREIIGWFEQQGDPETGLSDSRQQVWIGNGWVMKRRWSGETKWLLVVTIAEPGLEAAFVERFT
jgi:hypothetical protein